MAMFSHQIWLHKHTKNEKFSSRLRCFSLFLVLLYSHCSVLFVLLENVNCFHTLTLVLSWSHQTGVFSFARAEWRFSTQTSVALIWNKNFPINYTCGWLFLLIPTCNSSKKGTTQKLFAELLSFFLLDYSLMSTHFHVRIILQAHTTHEWKFSIRGVMSYPQRPFMDIFLLFQSLHMILNFYKPEIRFKGMIVIQILLICWIKLPITLQK